MPDIMQLVTATENTSRHIIWIPASLLLVNVELLLIIGIKTKDTQ